MKTDLFGERFHLSFQASNTARRIFVEKDIDTKQALVTLWGKYRTEIDALSRNLSEIYSKMTRSGFGAAFGDREGELLYIVIRETKPDLVYEISPNSGYSTNYILAALSKNGSGRLESFELIESFNGRPTREVIQSHMMAGLPRDQWNINIGDARITVVNRLKKEQPDFILLDSCHEDFFAEFYVKALLPHCKGWVAVQDIAHFDPRAEGDTEAYYLLSFLQKTESEFLLFGLYDDDLDEAVQETAARRPTRSNTVLFRPEYGARDPAEAQLLRDLLTGDGDLDRATMLYPLNARLERNLDLSGFLAAASRPEDTYVESFFSDKRTIEQAWYSDLLAYGTGRRRGTAQAVTTFVAARSDLDAEGLVLAGEAAGRLNDPRLVAMCSDELASRETRGADLMLRMARVCADAGLAEQSRTWAVLTLERAEDRKLATGYRYAFYAATILLKLGETARARDAFRQGLQVVESKARADRQKGSHEAYLHALKHPRFIPMALAADLDRSQLKTAATRGARLAASRVLRFWRRQAK